jgi:hypothetical protein
MSDRGQADGVGVVRLITRDVVGRHAVFGNMVEQVVQVFARVGRHFAT